MREVAIAVKMASPSAPPICWEELTSAAARPARDGGTPALAAVVVPTKTPPMPERHDQHPGQQVAEVAAVDGDP